MNCKEILIIDDFITKLCKYNCYIEVVENGNIVRTAITMERVSELVAELVNRLDKVQEDPDPLAPCRCDCDCCEKEEEPCPCNGRDCE